MFELLADRANAFEERDVTALERLAEMVQTVLEHADAAKHALEEIAAKNEQVVAHEKQPEPSEAVAETPAIAAVKIETVGIKEDKPAAVASVLASEPAETIEVKVEQPEPVPRKELDKIRNCEACGFPVSEGRTLCLDCEAARLSGDNPAPLASSQTPAFLAKLEARREQGWLSSHIYTIGTVLIVVLTVVLLVLRLR